MQIQSTDENVNTTPNSTAETMSGTPFNKNFAFTNHKGKYKRGLEKRQRRLFDKIFFIDRFLHDDEQVLLITTGCSPMPILEQLTIGMMIFQLKRSLFIITNKRIFHVPTKGNYYYRESIAQIPYDTCRKLYLRGSTIVAKYCNGKTEKFLQIPRKERKKIKIFLRSLNLQDQQKSEKCRTHLCPECATELIAGKYTCPNCDCTFKNEKDARKISIMYPGGGYFYTRHYILGILDAIAETFLAALLVVTFFDLFKGVPYSVSGIIFLGVILAIEKAITIYHSNQFIKEYIKI